MDINADCEHYQRKCLLLAPCCGRTYKCRLCHDSQENHNLDRKTVDTIVCGQCQTKQKVGRNCESCGILFGNYSCLQCRLFDDRDRQQFHCDECGICRVGGREKFFHCRVCDMCIATGIRDTHKCLTGASKGNCPVCLEFIHTSRKEIHVPKCSHLMHLECYKSLLIHGSFTCPVCNISLEDMTQNWEIMDKVVAETPMPEIYRNFKVNVLCRDCRKESKIVFHVVGLKCSGCGSYNTTRIAGGDPVPADPLNSLDDLMEELVRREDGETNVDDSGEESWETVSDGVNEDGEPESDVMGPENESAENEIEGAENESDVTQERKEEEANREINTDGNTERPSGSLG